MKQLLAIYMILLLLSGTTAGCGGGGKPAGNTANTGNATANNPPDSGNTENTTPQESSSPPADSGNTGSSSDAGGSNSGSGKGSGKADSLQAYADEWDRISDLHEQAINDYEGVIMELYTWLIPLTLAPVYETLNIDNKEGRHEGSLLLSGYPAFLEQKGNSFRFGYDAIRDQDGFAPGMKAGDRLLQEGSLEGDKGFLKIETRTERGGSVIEKVMGAYLISPQDTFLAIYQEANAIDIKGNENTKNTAVFLAMSEKEYNFVIAKGQSGTAFPEAALKESMSVQEAKELFIQAGYAIESSGGIIDGELIVNRE